MNGQDISAISSLSPEPVILTICFLYVILIYVICCAMEKTDMKRTKKIAVQIYLEPEQERVLKALSRATGRSKAAIVRSCISKSLSDIPPESDPAVNIMNLGSSGNRDISEKHDDYLY